MATNNKQVDVDVINDLQARLSQAYALLTVTQGEGDSFNQWSPEIKSDYLWACADLVDQAKGLSTQLIVSEEG